MEFQSVAYQQLQQCICQSVHEWVFLIRQMPKVFGTHTLLKKQTYQKNSRTIHSTTSLKMSYLHMHFTIETHSCQKLHSRIFFNVDYNVICMEELSDVVIKNIINENETELSDTKVKQNEVIPQPTLR